MPYIYLIKEREFIKTDEEIYKIGKTKQTNNKRFSSYPKGSILILQVYNDEVDKLEKKLIKIFNKKFTHAESYGKEYFGGNCNDMQNIIFDNLNLTDKIIKTKKDNTKIDKIKEPTYIENGEEFTFYHVSLKTLRKPMVDFLKGNEKIKIEQIPLITDYFHDLGYKNITLDFMKYYFNKNHFEYVDFRRMFEKEHFCNLSTYKNMYPMFNIIELIFDKVDDMKSFGIYSGILLNDKAELSPYYNMNKKNRESILRDQKYKFIEMRYIKGKLSKEKLEYLSQNKNMDEKIRKKYFG